MKTVWVNHAGSWIAVAAMMLLLTGCSATGLTAQGAKFTKNDRQLIAQYFQEFAPPPTPGPAKYRVKAAQVKDQSQYPEATFKKLVRGAGQPLPSALESQLSPLKSGYARVMVGWNVVVIKMNTGLVVDRVHALGY